MTIVNPNLKLLNHVPRVKVAAQFLTTKDYT